MLSESDNITLGCSSIRWLLELSW